MANVLTGLVGPIYDALHIVSRELTGFIPASTMYPGAERVALGQEITFPIASSATNSDVTAAMEKTIPGDETDGNAVITITKSRESSFYYTGEEELGLGISKDVLLTDKFAERFRSLGNELEADIAMAAYLASSRGYGTPGTAPFAEDLSDSANMLKILKDNGAPTSNMQIVFDTLAGVGFRTLTQLTSVADSGDTSLLRQGVLTDIHGFAFRESAQVASHTKGTGTGYLVNNGPFAVGATSIDLDTGSNTVLAGDSVSFVGDANNYIVKTALGGGTIVIAEPGLRQTLADGVAMTVGGNYTANLAFDKSAIQVIARPPATPSAGDKAIDRMLVQDPVSGLVFQIAVYPGYNMVSYEVSLAWGVGITNSNHIATLFG